MKKLDHSTYSEYLETTYSSWLGKIIGIRLGAPVEGWSYSQIREKYPEITGYVCDYGIFAADDDSNGPLFFVRSLLDKNDVTREDIGNTFLNYIQEYSGFFWWGGPGVSTEHTAYENLKNGIKAPLSGASKTNGIAIAEQIGGQIFSDCWGFVAGYDPELAVPLARKAASVTHDANGLEGAAFVAAAIVYAYSEKDIYTVINKALKHLDHDMKYRKVCRDIIRFYHENPDNWHDCLNYIFANYGYDKYPGVCHIIPNTALMIMAMCYGAGDFSKTMCMLVQSGWDTDCTAGNVGSIMGALVGLKGIETKWITPINDVLNASSCIGYLNIQTVSQSAWLFAALAMKLKGFEMPEPRHFCLPYATEGFFSDGSLMVENGKLHVEGNELYKYAYYLPEDVYDARYDPVYSPIVYPGDILEFDVDGEAVVFADDCEGHRFKGDAGTGTVRLQVPEAVNRTVHRFGLLFKDNVTVKDYRIINQSNIDIDFTNYKYDGYGPRYAGDTLYNIRAMVPHSGSWSLSEEGLKGVSEEHALITTGSLDFDFREGEMNVVLEESNNCYLVFDCTGYNHFTAVGICENDIVLIRKDNDIKILEKVPLRISKTSNLTLKVNMCNGTIKCNVNEYELRFTVPVVRYRGIAGIYIETGKVTVSGFKLHGQFKIE